MLVNIKSVALLVAKGKVIFICQLNSKGILLMKTLYMRPLLAEVSCTVYVVAKKANKGKRMESLDSSISLLWERLLLAGMH